MINLLLAVPSPHKHGKSEPFFQDFNYDILVVKFYTEHEAYQRIRNFFLDNKEYTHLVLVADDAEVKNENVEMLAGDIKNYNFPVISGACPINMDRLDLLALCSELPDKIHDKRHFNWINRNDVKGIIRVPHAGFPLQAIRRDVVEKIDFESEIVLYDKNYWGNYDIVFSYRCAELGIPIHANTDNYFLHYRAFEPISVGMYEPYMELIQKGKRIRLN